MAWDPNLWTIPLLLAGVLTATLAVFGWIHRAFPGLGPLSGFLAFVTLWILAYLGEILAAGTNTMVWFARVEYVGIVMVGPAWLAFALAYTGRSAIATPRRVVAMLTIPAITLLLAWTTPLHGALWQTFSVRNTAAGTVLAPTYGPWFWVNMGFQYGCLAVATFLLLWGIAKETSPLKGRARGIALALGSLAPWLANILYVSGWEAAAGIDLTVYGIAVAGVVFGWGILARGLIEIVPVARDKVVETSDEAVLVVDRRGRVVDANPMARETLEGPVPLFQSPADRALAHHGIDLAALPPGRRVMELQLGDPPRVRFFDCRVSELGNVEAASPGRVIALRDITEAEVQRRALEEGREALEAQLRQAQKLEMVGTMAGGIAHDFNNILAAIHGHAELAAMDLPESSATREDLEKILQGTVRARHLVRQILTFSRQAPENRRDISLSETFEEGLEFLRATVPSNIIIKANLDADGTTVFADSTQMQQVLMNLCSNSADAMADRKTGLLEITLSAHRPGPGQIPDHMTLDPGQEWVKLQVRDDGAGMDDATRRKVFEPFYTTKEVGRGTGLGMSVVHGIVINHGGWVEVTSRMGAGTTVTVWLPGSGGAPAEPDSRPDEDATPTATRMARVLVVDDEEELLQLTGRLLSGMGHEVRVARSVDEARPTIDSEPEWLDVLLVDFTMPRGTGLDLVRTLRAVRPDAPVILMTGFGDSVPPEELEAANVNILLPKPFSRLELVEAITPLLRRTA